ncbi:hypothetical protein Tco_0291997 [Tanacetum coccineum]
MSSASSAVTYTSVYTNSKPGRPVAPPSTNYIPGPEEPQTPPVPQDEDKHEPMFRQPHDPNYVPEPMYPEYIPLEDEHVFLTKEQPLPPVVSPTAESPKYVVKSDPEEDPEEYEDDETEDDDGDSHGDDADDEDEDEEDEDEEDEEEEEEHLALADSVVVVPTIELASISIPPEAEVERLLAMPTPPPSPLISLSPPSVGERLARCTAPSAHSSPPPMPSPSLPSYGYLTQIQTLKIAFTLALVDAVTTALPSPPLPPLPPSIYTPPPVDRRDDIPKFERPPRKRSCLFALGSRYEVGESSTARPTEIREVGVIELAELHEHDTQDLYALREDAQDNEEAYASREAWTHSVGLSQAVNYEFQTHREQVHKTRSQMQQAKMAELRETDRRRKAQMVEILRVMRDMRREMGDMQAELLALREQQRRARQPGPDVRVPDHQDASRDADSHI